VQAQGLGSLTSLVARLGLGLLVASASAWGACSSGEGDSSTGEGGGAPAMHPSWRRARVAVMEHAGSKVEILDVEFGESVGVVELPGELVALSIADSGEHILASTETGASIIYVGVAIVDHSEGSSDSDAAHIHVYKFDPDLVDLVIEGGAAPSVWGQAGSFAATFPGSASPGVAWAFAESALFEDTLPTPTRVDGLSPAPGPAVPSGPGLLVDVPGGITWADLRGGASAVGAPLVECSKVGARTGLGSLALVECDGALVSFESAGEAPVVKRLDPPFELGGDATLSMHPEGKTLLVSDSTGAWVWELGSSTVIALDLPALPCDVAYEPGYARTITALGADGVLYQLDAEGGQVLHRRVVSAPFECGASPRPSLTQVPSRAYVALPTERRVDEFWLDDGLAPLGSYATSVVPSKVLAVGIDRATRNLGDLSDVQ
jgi:hypothetical protein